MRVRVRVRVRVEGGKRGGRGGESGPRLGVSDMGAREARKPGAILLIKNSGVSTWARGRELEILNRTCGVTVNTLRGETFY